MSTRRPASAQATAGRPVLVERAALVGLVTGGARLDNPQRLRTESYNFFVNDSIRITPRLTLSAGLRYEYNSPPVDAGAQPGSDAGGTSS